MGCPLAIPVPICAHLGEVQMAEELLEEDLFRVSGGVCEVRFGAKARKVGPRSGTGECVPSAAMLARGQGMPKCIGKRRLHEAGKHISK